MHNPYAIYVHCDGAMDYDSKNTGGVGFHIKFPESVDLEDVAKSIGKYQKANIERLELEALIQGMGELLRIFESKADKLKEINTVIFTTDRFGLNDEIRTNTYRIREYRKNKWENHEGKAIKNSDLLDKIDKLRKKFSDQTRCLVKIEFLRRKYNKVADKLAKVAKKKGIYRNDIALHGQKIGKRKYSDCEINYKFLNEKDELDIHIFKKELVRNQWEIHAEICKGEYIGKKIKIYTDFKMEKKLHRHHVYSVKIKKIFNHHLGIFRTIKEVKNI